MKLKNHHTVESGFTLVELAIVLMIIGLLISGVLRGQELMNNARVTSTVQQAKAYEGADVTFRDTYGQTPEDMGSATARLPGCTPANFCVNGNSNGVVGTRKVGIGLLDFQNRSAAPAVETTMFWKHLALTHLISGVNPGADPDQPEVGRTHPAAKIAGAFMIVYGQHVPNTREGLWLVLTSSVSGFGPAYQPNSENPISPIQARQIDTKMDDGLADVGDVVAPDNGTCDQPDAQNIRQYRNVEDKTCMIVISISG